MNENELENKPRKILVRVDPDLEDIVPEFLEDSWKELEELTRALQTKDYERIRFLGHSMKGVGDFGFDYMRSIGASLELSAEGMQLEEAERLVEELSTYLESVEVVFE